MIAFFALGVLFVGFSLWALFLTDIPQEQFQEDPRFEEEYVKYYQWNILFWEWTNRNRLGCCIFGS